MLLKSYSIFSTSTAVFYKNSAFCLKKWRNNGNFYRGMSKHTHSSCQPINRMLYRLHKHSRNCCKTTKNTDRKKTEPSRQSTHILRSVEKSCHDCALKPDIWWRDSWHQFCWPKPIRVYPTFTEFIDSMYLSLFDCKSVFFQAPIKSLKNLYVRWTVFSLLSNLEIRILITVVLSKFMDVVEIQVLIWCLVLSKGISENPLDPPLKDLAVWESVPDG